MTEAELLAAIVAAPGDAAARAVYADWLEERGDPRGEYLRLEALLHDGPARLRALRATLDPGWLASVTRHYDVVLFDGGPSKITVIELVREISGLGLRDANDLVESTPRSVITDQPYDEALQLVARLRATGAHADVTPTLSAHVDLQFDPMRRQQIWLVTIAPGKRMEAIRSVDEGTGLGLAAATEVIDAVMRGEPRELVLEGRVSEISKRVARLRWACQVAVT